MNGINLLLLTLVLSSDPDAPLSERALPETQARNPVIESALKDLEKPAGEHFVASNLSTFSSKPAATSQSEATEERLDPESAHAWSDLVADCPYAIDLLVKAPRTVEATLIWLAENDPRLPTRWRAIWVLARRGHSLAVPLVEKMARSQSANERALAWASYSEAIREGYLPVPKDTTFALHRFEAGEWSSALPWILGRARAKAAVPLLLARLKSGGANEREMVLALGEIATPEAVAYLISRLEAGSGGVVVDALAASGNATALPALTAHLAALKKQPEPCKWEIAATRVAMLRVSRKDPRDDLLRLAEDRQEDEDVRGRALGALSCSDRTELVPRLLKLYASEKGSWFITSCCIDLLRDQQYPGITEAMLAHARVLGNEPLSMGSNHFQLLFALNRRLGTKYRTIDGLLEADRQRTRSTGPDSSRSAP
jgi:HEAT repeat protein